MQAFGEMRYLRDNWGVKGDIKFSGLNADRHLVGTSTDLIECDFLGGVGKVKLRGEDGMLKRDLSAGTFPRPAWKWVHGKFTLEGATHGLQ
jgi:hypothetical protein